MQRGKLSERLHFWIKMKQFSCPRNTRGRRTPPLEQLVDAVNSYFSPGATNRWLFSILLDKFFFSPRLFFFLQFEQPMTVRYCFFLRMFFPFSRLFFTFSDDKLLVWFLRFALSDGVSACVQHQSCTYQRCFGFTGLVPRLMVFRLAGIFSLSVFFRRYFLLFGNFPLTSRCRFWLLTSDAKLRFSSLKSRENAEH